MFVMCIGRSEGGVPAERKHVRARVQVQVLRSFRKPKPVAEKNYFARLSLHDSQVTMQVVGSVVRTGEGGSCLPSWFGWVVQGLYTDDLIAGFFFSFLGNVQEGDASSQRWKVNQRFDEQARREGCIDVINSMHYPCSQAYMQHADFQTKRSTSVYRSVQSHSPRLFHLPPSTFHPANPEFTCRSRTCRPQTSP